MPWFEPQLQCLGTESTHRCQTRLGGKSGTRTHLAGTNGTFDEAKGGHNRVPASARASPCLVAVKVAAWERKKKKRKSQSL